MNKINEEVPQLFKKRWLILILFCLYEIANTIQFIQYSVVADVAVSYYKITYDTVDWSSLIFSITYSIFSFPGGYLIDRIGLRITILIGAVGTALGAWIKVLSVDPDRFWVVLLGQGITSVFQVAVLPLAPKVSATWFGADEVSSATSLGIIGAQLGTAIGYIIPPFLVTQSKTEDIERGFYINTLIVAAYGTFVIAIIFFLFDNNPLVPPSVAQLKIIKDQTNYKKTIKNLITNVPFILYLIIFVINMGAYTPFTVLLNQIILYYYPNAAADVGILGLVITCISFAGSFLGGYLLDKFRKYRLTTLLTHLLYLLSTTLFVATLDLGLPVVYVTASIAGLCMGAVLTLGIELIVEITYPEPENITVGVLICIAQISSSSFVFLYSYIFKNVNIMWANATVCLIILIADLLFFFMNFDLKRQNAQKTPETRYSDISKINVPR